MLKKTAPRKKSFPKTYVLAALLVLSFGIIHLLNQRVVYDETKQTWYFSGSSINSEESTSYTLFDGSKLSFKGPSSVIFQDKNNIQINRGLLDAKIVPRKNDKLNFLTPSGKFTVLGTQFSLWVQKSTSLLKVSEGKVGIQDKVISTNQKALIEKGGNLLTDIREINNFSSLMLMRKLADDPKASFITDFKLLNEKFTNWVNQRQISIPDHIYPTELGLQFNEKGAIEVIPVGKPSNQWNLSLWLKYSKPNFRQAILSHEDFRDHNTGGWNLYYFDNFIRLHTVHKSYHHDQGDIPNLRENEWFHLSINVKSSGFGSIVEDMYINGKIVQTHRRKMLFMHKQASMLIGGLSQNAMSVFGTRDQKHNFYFKGEMANLVYMNRILKPETIKQLFELNFPQNPFSRLRRPC